MRVVAAHPLPLMRDLLVSAFDAEPDIDVVASAGTMEHRPDPLPAPPPARRAHLRDVPPREISATSWEESSQLRQQGARPSPTTRHPSQCTIACSRAAVGVGLSLHESERAGSGDGRPGRGSWARRSAPGSGGRDPPRHWRNTRVAPFPLTRSSDPPTRTGAHRAGDRGPDRPEPRSHIRNKSAGAGEGVSLSHRRRSEAHVARILVKLNSRDRYRRYRLGSVCGLAARPLQNRLDRSVRKQNSRWSPPG